MGLEATNVITGLVATNPDGADLKSQGDDHLRLLKAVLLYCFPYISGAVSASDVELSYVKGVTSAIQTQLNLLAPKASPTFTGTPAAPTPAASDNSTTLATTAFVVAAFAAAAASAGLSSTTPSANKIPLAYGTGLIDAGWLNLRNIRVLSASATAVANDYIITIGPITITLPASPVAGQSVVYLDVLSGTPIIARNGANINGFAQDITLDMLGRVTFVYIDSTRGWRVSKG